MDDIPLDTLNHYINIIKLQSIFTIHNNVLNKTQSRAVAEWSFCLTIAYFMTVLMNHYLPDAQPSAYHSKHKDMSKDALETLQLVEGQYNKMIGNKEKKVSLTPILPNLFRSTDEVTIFATLSKVHTKYSF